MLRPQELRDNPAIASSGSIRLTGRTSPVCTVYTVAPRYPPAHRGSNVEDLRHLDAAGDRHVEAPHGTPDADRRRPSTITLNCDLVLQPQLL